MIPGGECEPGESEEDFVKREVREETHLHVEVDRLIHETVVSDDMYGMEKTYACRIVAGVPRPGTESEVDTAELSTVLEVGWFNLTDPESWDPLALNDPITGAKLHQMRLALGYMTETAPLTIRKATRDDVEFLASVDLLANEKRCAERPDWNPERALERLRAAAVKQVDGMEENSMTYVIESDRTPVGRLRLVRPGDRLHLAGIQIHPAHQRKGIGSSILSDLMKEADENALPLTLEVDKDNPDAMRLYLRLGFEVIEDRGEKDLMEKHVSAGN